MDKLQRLIEILCAERGETAPYLSEKDKPAVFRALCNLRPPIKASEEFIKLQDEYLQEATRHKGVTDIEELFPIKPDIYLWQGDITTLKCDGIVNAANSQMLGCFYPNHSCIDNAIHTFAGVQLRQACAEIMKKQRGEKQAGQTEITLGYNLPCKYVLHTVGPSVFGKLNAEHKKQLEKCYLSCLSLAEKHKLTSLAFCCISTGEFRFPNVRAAEIAVKTVEKYKQTANSDIKVIFNVFKNQDHEIYARLLAPNT